jgi:apolipoprotein N-acyltransferase
MLSEGTITFFIGFCIGFTLITLLLYWLNK